MAWSNAVMYSANEFTAFGLHKRLSPEQIYNRHGISTSCGIWDKYLKGDVTPTDGFSAEGKPHIVAAVGLHYPDTLKAFRHILWTASHRRVFTTADIQNEMKGLTFQEAKYYKNFSVLAPVDPDGDLLEALGGELWIEHGDWEAALHHLAMHIMLIQWGERGIGRNTAITVTRKIGMLLGAASESPWIHSFHPQLFDWLEASIWGGLFDDFYPLTQENAGLHGWRRCVLDWNTGLSPVR
jgi:hypothetical protein